MTLRFHHFLMHLADQVICEDSYLTIHALTLVSEKLKDERGVFLEEQ